MGVYVLYESNLGKWFFGARVVKRNRPGFKKKDEEGSNSVSLKTARSPRRRGNLAQKFQTDTAKNRDRDKDSPFFKRF